MGDILTLIQSTAWGICLLLAALFLWGIYRFSLAYQNQQHAQFGLEREIAQRQGGQSITVMFLSVELIVLVWALATITTPAWQMGSAAHHQSVANPRPFVTMIPSHSEGFQMQDNPTESLAIPATAPAPSTPPGTIEAPGGRSGCIFTQAYITIPDDGMVIFEPTEIRGTASIPDFSFYRFEIQASGQNQAFQVLPQDYTQPVVDGHLGQLIPDLYDEGTYRFRLAVFNTRHELRASCEISIVMRRP